MKNSGKKSNTAQAVFKKTQWKFTVIILSVATILLAASFVAIYIFTTLTNQLRVINSLRNATDYLVELGDKSDEVTENDLIEEGYDFLLYYVEVVKIDIDEEYNYTIIYDITKSYNTRKHNDTELDYIKTKLVEDIETAGSSFIIDPGAGKSFLCASTLDPKFETFERPLTEEDGKTAGIKEPQKPGVKPAPEDPDEPGEDEPDPTPPATESVVITLSNKWIGVYDYSAQQSTLTTLLLVLIVVFVIAILLVSVLGFVLSGRVLHPAKEAFSRQKELVANASHELKTPITIINANLDVLSSNGKSLVEENKKWLDHIEDQTRRMNELVIEMLELSSFENSQYKPDLQVMNLSEEIEGAVLSFEAACFERNITLETGIKPNVRGFVDKKGVSKLILILLDNAIKYCNANGEIMVKLRSQKRVAVLSVANSGAKIPDDKMEKLFDRFYKVGDNSTSFGLGLSMAKSIVENMNGKITCSSNDEFTEFVVNIPLNQ